MKVLHILSSDIFSGAEHVACEIIDLFKHEIIMGYSAPPGINESILKEREISFVPLKNMSIYEIRRIVKRYNPDIIHAHDFRASVLSVLTTFRIPVVAHIHNNNPWLKSLNMYSIIFLLASGKINKIVGVSRAIFDEFIFKRCIKHKFVEISNPIDVHSIIQKSKQYSVEKKYDLIFLGRLSTEKGPREFIRIVHTLSQKIPGIKAVVIGDGHLKKECLDDIEHYKLKENIDFLGFISNPIPYIKSCKVMIIPSLWEGFGLAAVEALSLGKPVVASKVGGLMHILSSDCGELCTSNSQFVQEVYKLLTDTSYYSIKSELSLKRAMELDNKLEYRNKLFEIYSSLNN